MPPAVARPGSLLPPDGGVNIKASRLSAQHGPVEEGCDCYTCRNYSAAYVHHLARAEEQLYYRLGSIHNIRFMLRLASEIRASIMTGTFPEFRDTFLARYVPTSEKVREDQREKWKAARSRLS